MEKQTRTIGVIGRGLAVLALAACGDGNEAAPLDATGDAAADLPLDTSGEPDAGDAVADLPIEVPPAPEGTRLVFEWERGWDRAGGFFAFPFPSDLRRDGDGTISFAHFPNPNRVQLVDGLFAAAEQATAFSSVSTALFRFDGPTGLAELEEFAAVAGSPVLIVDIDPGSSERGRLFAAWAQAVPAEAYTPEFVVGVAPRPGMVLRPDTTYAYVLMRSLGDGEGAPLGVPPALWAMAHGAVPEGGGGAELAAAYAPLWETLRSVGVDPAQVAAATVFSTTDVVAQLFALSEHVRDVYSPAITDLVVDADDGTAHPRFCEVLGRIDMPQFQQGTPPFDAEGLFVPGEDGLPVEQRTESMPVVINLPLGEMPADGWPLVMYFHGSGGIAAQVVDRGPIGPGGEAKGEGPAHVLAAHGLATVGSAHPLSPDRLRGATSLAYLNFSNLSAFRDTFRQGAIEQRLLLDALLEVEIDPSVVAGCEGLALPAGAGAHVFDPEPVMAMGQSMGGMYTNMIGAIEPRIRAVVPTGAGGYWSYMLPITDLVPGLETLLPAVIETEGPITYMHPVLVMLQNAWEVVEPLVYLRRLSQEPLPGHPSRPVYEPAGQGDSYFDPEIYDAMALAYGHQQAGPVVWAGMQQALALIGLDGMITYPVSNNRTALDGTTQYTGVVVQYAGDGVTDPHTIFSQFDDVKHQYGCFLETFHRTGRAVVPAPAAIGTPCDE